MTVADASVVLKWVLPDEPFRGEALSLRQLHFRGADLVAAPELLLYEAANALSTRYEEVALATEAFREICAAELTLHALEVPEFLGAIELAYRYGISVYDASYVALAQSLRCRFVTTDERLLACLKGVPHVLHLSEMAR